MPLHFSDTCRSYILLYSGLLWWVRFQGGHGTGKTGNLVLTFSRQGKHREFCCNTGKIFETQGKYLWLYLSLPKACFPSHIFNFFSLASLDILSSFRSLFLILFLLVYQCIYCLTFFPYHIGYKVSTKLILGSFKNKFKKCNLEYVHLIIF